RLFSNSGSDLRIGDELTGGVADLLKGAARGGWEGVIRKRRGSAYQKGRSHGWLKLKALATQELAVVGWTPGEGSASSGIGALLLGVNDGGSLEFAGMVGTGFSA